MAKDGGAIVDWEFKELAKLYQSAKTVPPMDIQARRQAKAEAEAKQKAAMDKRDLRVVGRPGSKRPVERD